jgi:hypothetical protein
MPTSTSSVNIPDPLNDRGRSPNTMTLAIECAEALVAWDSAHTSGVTGRELRRLRLGYYDRRLQLVERIDRALALGLIAQVLSWGES